MPKSTGPNYNLAFEQPLTALDDQICALEAREDKEHFQTELDSLHQNRENLLAKLYQNLTPWDTVRVARHPDRPQTKDYIHLICRDFRELHGDRNFGDDPAIITGFGRIGAFSGADPHSPPPGVPGIVGSIVYSRYEFQIVDRTLCCG